jgi:ABC-type multidrug transport system fused ATPase/permease subunit
MIQFQRVSAFCKLEPEEAPKAESKEHELDPSWPRSSDVEFNNVTVRYSPDGPDVLKDVSIKFDAKERTAIVGRTGSGKTTVWACLRND